MLQGASSFIALGHLPQFCVDLCAHAILGWLVALVAAVAIPPLAPCFCFRMEPHPPLAEDEGAANPWRVRRSHLAVHLTRLAGEIRATREAHVVHPHR